MNPDLKNVLVTGGAGYVGSVLVPKLVAQGYRVTVLDLLLYGDKIFAPELSETGRLKVVKGDIRDTALLEKLLPGIDAVIHLACISNDPSFDLNPGLGRSINLDAFEPLVKISKSSKVKRFIYASSSSVYGVKDTENVNEEMDLEPLTDYSKFKAACETILQRYDSPDFTTVTVRPATVCGYAPRQRLDVIVNILVNHAYTDHAVKVFGGTQKRPNIHIEDMADLYLLFLSAPKEKIANKVFNAGCANHSVEELALLVKDAFGGDIKVVTEPTNDPRSYHISSAKIAKELNFVPKHSIEDAVRGLKEAFEKGKLPNSMSDKRYFNIKTMLEQKLV